MKNTHLFCYSQEGYDGNHALHKRAPRRLVDLHKAERVTKVSVKAFMFISPPQDRQFSTVAVLPWSGRSVRWLQEHSTQFSLKWRRFQLKTDTCLHLCWWIYHTWNTQQEWSSWEDTTEAVKKYISAYFKFAKELLDVPQHYWQNILRWDETQGVSCGRNTQQYVWRTPTSKLHPSCGVWWREPHVLGLLCRHGPWQISILDLKMNSQVNHTM